MSTKAIEKKRSIRKSLLLDRRGLSTVEYVIILALIAIAGISIWRTFGTTLTDKVTQYTTDVGGL